jgi:hypothetical protein
MEAAVPPVLQRYVPPPDAVRVALSPRTIIPSLLETPDVSDTEMDADGSGFTVIVVVAVAVQLFVVTVTV